MASRKVKHARALAKREEWFKTVHEGNFNVLSKVRSQREQEAAEAKKKEKDQKIEKSKRLAQQNGVKPSPKKKAS